MGNTQGILRDFFFCMQVQSTDIICAVFNYLGERKFISHICLPCARFTLNSDLGKTLTFVIFFFISPMPGETVSVHMCVQLLIYVQQLDSQFSIVYLSATNYGVGDSVWSHDHTPWPMKLNLFFGRRGRILLISHPTFPASQHIRPDKYMLLADRRFDTLFALSMCIWRTEYIDFKTDHQQNLI